MSSLQDPDVDPVMDAEVHDEANMYDGLIGECFKVVFGQHPTKIKNFGALDPMFLQSLGALAHQHLRQAVLHVTRSTRLRQISALVDIMKSMSGELHIEHIVKIVLQRIKGIMGVARSSLFIVEPKKGDIWSLSSDGMQPIRLPQGVGLVGACANSGQVINIYDAYSDERFNRAVDIATGFKTKNILCVPVHNQKHEVVAVIQGAGEGWMAGVELREPVKGVWRAWS
eukprot:gene31270-39293_t